MQIAGVDRRQLLTGSSIAVLACALPTVAWRAPTPLSLDARLIRLLDRDTALLTMNRKTVALRRNEALGEWTLVELIDGDDPFVVLEDFDDLYSPMVLVGLSGTRARLSKTAEALLEREAGALLQDLETAMQRSTLKVADETILPTIAGAKEPFHVVMQRDKADPQWRSYRSWMEMLHSGLLSDERINQVVDYREQHHDIILGVPMAYGYRTYEMAGFLSYGHGFGLIQADRVREAQLMMLSHMAHQYTRCMWCAPETRRLAKGEWASAYCSPSQLVMPLMTRWLLAFEDPRDDSLWLGKGMPRDWLTKPVSVDRIPTKWGRVAYRLEPRGRALVATVDLPEKPILSVNLRLRHPEGRKLS